MVMVKRELRSLTKEKTILLAIIIQLFIASFSSIIVAGLMSFYDPETIGQNTRINVKVGIFGDTSTPLIGFLRNRNLIHYCPNDVIADLLNKKINNLNIT